MKNTKQAFVILIAVLVSTLVISIGAFIASIAVKELQLSASGRESQNAFYAADSALECALYHDLRIEQFGSSTGTPSLVYCNGENFPISISSGDPVNSDTRFEISFTHNGLTADQSPYARVRVLKSDIGTIDDKTIIEAQGYNVKDNTRPNRVERALQVVY